MRRVDVVGDTVQGTKITWDGGDGVELMFRSGAVRVQEGSSRNPEGVFVWSGGERQSVTKSGMRGHFPMLPSGMQSTKRGECYPTGCEGTKWSTLQTAMWNWCSSRTGDAKSMSAGALQKFRAERVMTNPVELISSTYFAHTPFNLASFSTNTSWLTCCGASTTEETTQELFSGQSTT